MIESVSVAGVEVDQLAPSKLPRTLRQRLKSLVGERCDVAMLEDLSAQIRRELHFRTVTEHLSKGSAPDRIRVNFEVVRRDLAFDISLPKFLYHSQQGFTGELDASTRFRQNDFTFGMVSNGDDLTERFTGITARYDSAAVGDRTGFTSASRSRTITSNGTRPPSTRFPAAASISTGRAGMSLPSSRSRSPVRLPFPSARASRRWNPRLPVAGSQSANAATLDVHYGRKIEGDRVQQQIDGKYSLRVATRALGSTYAYARHLVSVKYEAKSGRHTVSDEFTGRRDRGPGPIVRPFRAGQQFDAARLGPLRNRPAGRNPGRTQRDDVRLSRRRRHGRGFLRYRRCLAVGAVGRIGRRDTSALARRPDTNRVSLF